MPRPSNRARLLDAYEELLVSGVGATVTLDAVAAAAGVSKGGLLYHFPSKDALVDGVAERLGEHVAADVEALGSAPEGPVAYWLTTSTADAQGELTRTYQATLRLAGAGHAAARTALLEADRAWSAALEARIADPVLARLVRLVGDGLYLEGLAGLPTRGDTPALVELLEQVLR
ncbi:hypothetical protein ASG36_14240 [Geodermatophilus sp. Leaf369]|uniref:TetR/AcrR family transcriptional regulator n=1 Tax=Geodermatophilus sp. Leaf369 TaxID=1736354 RepID=UPI0006FA309A|nr:TetR/AcrR family transcriptional regulator [Geodermatophilus sp. Leaf369]KQS59087.1 hypothetical protein ASG36_14240 [Geodermatophilus sp. Leaf369]